MNHYTVLESLYMLNNETEMQSLVTPMSKSPKHFLYREKKQKEKQTRLIVVDEIPGHTRYTHYLQFY